MIWKLIGREINLVKLTLLPSILGNCLVLGWSPKTLAVSRLGSLLRGNYKLGKSLCPWSHWNWIRRQLVCQASGKAAEKLAEKLQKAIVAKLQRIEVKTSLSISCMFRQIKRIIYVSLVLVNLLVVIPTPQFTDPAH